MKRGFLETFWAKNLLVENLFVKHGPFRRHFLGVYDTGICLVPVRQRTPGRQTTGFSPKKFFAGKVSEKTLLAKHG